MVGLYHFGQIKDYPHHGVLTLGVLDLDIGSIRARLGIGWIFLFMLNGKTMKIRGGVERKDRVKVVCLGIAF